jgi:hypothetical protein
MNPLAEAIKKVVIGLIIAEYGLMELREYSKRDLKARTNVAIAAIKRVQDYFLHHPESKPEHREIFKREFVKSEIFMLSELVKTVWGMDDNTIEIIIESIKQNIAVEQ